jgi:hypothetical protein
MSLSSPTPSTSDWVSSMVMAAEVPLTESWEPISHHSSWPTEFSQTQAPVAGPSSHPFTSTTGPQLNPSNPILAIVEPHTPLSKPPPPLPTIGMKPDQDPSSKHGLFQISSATISSQSPTDSEAGAYIPNPARTLVMEQLPKTHRTADFVNSWSKMACGAHPVYLAIDPPAAKALVEFATSELARKAWRSPRLGTAFAGLKPHQLKGRPREDLIKVWWYRVDGVGAGAGVGEIEEGEIEGDAGEKEVDVPVKKETKKERKARLAKERAEKQKKEPPNKKVVEKPPQPQHPLPPLPQLASAAHLIPYVPQMVSPIPMSFPFSSPTLSLYTSGDPYHGPMAMPYPFTSLPFRQNQLPHQLRGPLPPQSDLGSQWRGASKKKNKTHYGASTRQKVAGETMSEGSIASSRSPSPVAGTSAIHQLGTGESGADTNLQTQDTDDMELDSPDSCRRPSFGMLLIPESTESMEHDMPPPPPALPPPPPPSSLPPRPSSPQPPLILETPIPKVGQPLPLQADSDFTTPFSPLLSITTAMIPSPSKPSPDSSVPLATPPPSTVSPTLTATPPLAPSEPRAMKNAPKGPSYAKRSLLARHKDLEERIARSKMELGLLRTESPLPMDNPSSLPTPPPSEATHPAVDKLAMEERLRSLVLQSQRNKMKAAASVSSTTSPDPSPSSPALLSTSSSTSTLSHASSESFPVPTSTITSHSFSLDDLAVSFITETIQTYKATPQPPKPSAAAVKLELAAKQKRLEQHIAESKILMAKLTQARTKQEKDAILAVMRERSRCVRSSCSLLCIGEL